MRLVSVVIPLFNKEKWVARCIESVLKQAYTNLEILVIDDGSTDGGAEIVRSNEDDRIRLVIKLNGGLSTARNRGIDEAKGDFVTFVDADDEILPNHIHQLVGGFELGPDIVAVADRYLETFQSSVQPVKEPFARERYHDLGGVLYARIEDYIATLSRRFFLLSGSSTMLKRDVLKKHELRFFTDAEPAEDVNFWIRLSRIGNFVYSPEPGAVWHHDDPNSIMMKDERRAIFVPPFLEGLGHDQFSDLEILHLKRFLRWEYFKKAYQNQGKPFVRKELSTRFQCVDIGWICTLPYMAIRYMPRKLLRYFAP